MKIALSAIGIILVFIYAIGSGLWVNTGDNWYQSLNSPQWQPPDIVFGLIWPYNFIMLGTASVIVATTLNTRWSATYLAILALSIGAALTWAYQFYRPHNLSVASSALAVAAFLTLPIVLITWKASLPVGLALVPYQGWLITATFLSFSYAKLNG